MRLLIQSPSINAQTVADILMIKTTKLQKREKKTVKEIFNHLSYEGKVPFG